MATPSATVNVTTDAPPTAETGNPLPAAAASAARSHTIRRFDYARDLQDLNDICANVYGGTDYMPRIIHRIASDPGVLVLAAAEVAAEVGAEAVAVEVAAGAAAGVAEEVAEEVAAEVGSEAVAAEVVAEVAAGPSPVNHRHHRHQHQHDQPHRQQQQLQQQQHQLQLQRGGGGIDGIVCGERRGSAVWLYGLRVREGTRGRGLGHVLMEAICRLGPQLLAAAPDAEPPPPLTPPVDGPSADPAAAADATTASSSSGGPAAPPSAPAPAAAAAAVDGAASITQIITCTVPYNLAAQRIIGRQLPGPLYDVELWPPWPSLEAYEAAAGWVRGAVGAAGGGLPPSAVPMLEWLPGALDVLQADTEAQALMPYWRRVTSGAQLRSAVADLLYGSAGGGGAGCAAEPAVAAASPLACGGLLWLPMPYDLWPLDSAFVQRELAAGNIWLLTRGAPTDLGDGADGDADRAAGGDERGGAVLAVLLLTHFETLSRVCAGTLARSSAATHAAILHAASLQKHFFMSALRLPAGRRRRHLRGPLPSAATAAAVTAVTVEAAAAAAVAEVGAEPAEAPPAVYGVTGGHGAFMVYGGGADRAAAVSVQEQQQLQHHQHEEPAPLCPRPCL